MPLSSSWNWSNIYTNIVYGIRYAEGTFNEFGYYNTDTGVFTEMTKFDQYRNCNIGRGEGRMSNDDQFIVLSCRNSEGRLELVSFSLSENAIVATIDAHDAYDWATVTPSGRYILVRNNIGESRQLLRYSR